MLIQYLSYYNIAAVEYSMKFPTFIIIVVIVAAVLVSGCAMFCKPNWQCTYWTQCNIAGTQSRTCTDLNSCGSATGKPPESQSCTPQTTAQIASPIVGHPFSIGGRYYDSDPTVPLINQIDINGASLGAVIKIDDFDNYNDLYNQYYYQCFSLKNEGTAAYTTAQSATAGTASIEQLLNFYNIAKDTIQREENCQESIRVFQNHKFGLFQTSPSNQLYNELNQNMQISTSDENIAVNNYNTVARRFNGQILKCDSINQVIGTDGICHDTCSASALSASKLYCPSDSTCVSGTCLRCLPGFQLTANIGGYNCIQI